ncbi:MAG: hypothetical protein WCO12_02405, partial [bacterium]
SRNKARVAEAARGIIQFETRYICFAYITYGVDILYLVRVRNGLVDPKTTLTLWKDTNPMLCWLQGRNGTK